MMFNETRLLDCVAYGSEFGQQYRTRIVQLRSGVERRNADWMHPLGRYSVIYQNLKKEHHELVVDAHHACQGSLIGFRFKDWADYQAAGDYVGAGTGSPEIYQLRRAYSYGSVTGYRPISKPVSGTVQIFVDGVETAAPIDHATGQFTLSAADGAAVTWSGEFDIPVRFVSDEIAFSFDNRTGGIPILNSNVELIEVRL